MYDFALYSKGIGIMKYDESVAPIGLKQGSTRRVKGMAFAKDEKSPRR